MKLLDRFLARATTAAPTKAAPDNWVGPPAPHVIAHTWLQLPTLRSAGRLVNIVGESFHQDALEVVSSGRTEEGAAVPLVTAQLVREPENPYDSNAVRVDIGGFPVGHLARNEAPLYHATLDTLAETGRPATCRAWLTGGWARGALDRGHFGVRLDVHRDLKLGGGALLPFGDGRVTVQGEEQAQDHLSELLSGTDRIEIVAVLGQPAERIGVWVGGQLVGTLTPKMSERYGPWIGEAQAALLPASCEARVIRGPKKIEVFLKLAMPWEESR